MHGNRNALGVYYILTLW